MKVEHLTFTRFVAAILVVLYHIGASHLDPSSFLGSLLGVGDAAVSYFFTLSGFILVVSSVRGGQLPARLSGSQFWRNRFARVYPLYCIALLLTVSLGLLTNSEKTNDLNAASITASALLLQAWWPQFVMQLNYPGWSLSVEMLFYFLFPFIYMLAVAQPTRVLAMGTGLFWAFCLGVHVIMIEAHVVHDLALYFPPLHLGTFMVGVTTGIVFVRHQDWLINYRRQVTAVFMIALVGSFWVVLGHLPILKYHHNGLFAPLFALFIVWLSAQRSGLTRWLSRPLPVRLGEISYGVYILQVPVGIVTYYTSSALLHWPVWLYLIVYLGILSGMSALFYHGVEQPARRLIRQWTGLLLPSAPADEQLSRPA